MSLEERKIWLEGKLVAWPEVTVHLLSQSVQRGSLVFDVMQVCETARGPAIFGLREHTERFMNSAALNGMELEHDLDALLAAIAEVVRANPGCEIVKISGYYDSISFDVLPANPHVCVAVAAFSIADIAPSGAGERPNARLQIAHPRKMPSSVLSPQIKVAASYTHAAVAKKRARAEGFHDVLFLDEYGNLAESSTQSFFLVTEGLLRSAPTDLVLAGITRRAVIDLARDEGLIIKEEPLPGDLLARAEEAFLTGTSSGVWAVERIDGHELPAPVPGPISSRLIERFARMLEGEDPVFSPRWVQSI